MASLYINPFLFFIIISCKTKNEIHYQKQAKLNRKKRLREGIESGSLVFCEGMQAALREVIMDENGIVHLVEMEESYWQC
jgi:hypothetical protein